MRGIFFLHYSRYYFYLVILIDYMNYSLLAVYTKYVFLKMCAAENQNMLQSGFSFTPIQTKKASAKQFNKAAAVFTDKLLSVIQRTSLQPAEDQENCFKIVEPEWKSRLKVLQRN